MRIPLLLLSATCLASVTAAEVRLPALFSDGMVLQRGAEVTVWGWADPGEVVVVKGGWLGSWIAGPRSKADDGGRWSVTIKTPEDAGSTTVSISSKTTSITLKDVLLGEVWLCSGQSNMEWDLARIKEAADTIGAESGAVTGKTLAIDRPSIRFFDVPRVHAMEPAEDVKASWVPAVGEAALPCSAVAYYFACALQDELEVPVGLVVSAWGGTRAQAWTSGEVVRNFPDHARAIDAVLNSGGDEAGRAARIDAYWSEVDGVAFYERAFADADFDDGHWDEQVQPANFRTGPLGNHDGVAWYRRTIDVPKRWDGKKLELILPPLDDIDQTFWNGTQIGTMIEAGAWNTPRKYTIPGELVAGGAAVVTVRVVDTGGGGGMVPGHPMRLKRGQEFIELQGPWRIRKGPSVGRLPKAPFPVARNQHTPSALFNGMLAPLIPFKVQGALWYQGESNRVRSEEYRALFPSMIVDWRTRWNDLMLPFYFVQIAPYNYGEGKGQTSITAELREAQAMARELPRTGMVLTADIGDPRDIHPVNKWEVGRRLSLFALRDVYGRTDVQPEGPRPAQIVRQAETITVTFSNVGDALSVRGDELLHFEVAGADGKFVAAQASITGDGRGVVLRADGVAQPKHARYLWSDAAEATLMASTGLPAEPFRTTDS